MKAAYRTVCVGVALLFFNGSPAATQEHPLVVAFVDVTVVPMDTERVLPHHTVVVEDGHITALGPREQVPVPAGAKRIDGRGQFLLPGLADMHTHLAYATMFDTTGGSQAVRVADAERELFLLLANGVTTVRNLDHMGGNETANDVPVLDGPTLLQLRARAAAAELWSPRIYTSSKWRLDTTRSVDENVATYTAAGYDHLKIYWESSTILDSLVPAAHRMGMPLVGHGFDSDLPRTLALGLKSIEHLTPYWPSSTSTLDSLPQLAAATARAGIWNSQTTGLFEGAEYGNGTQSTPLERRYGARIQAQIRRRDIPAWDFKASDATPFQLDVPADRIVKALQNAGAGLLLGTDMASNMNGLPGFTVHRNLQSFVLYGLTPYQALVTATRNVAAYFGTEDSTGTVAVGKRADLLLLAANPLIDIHHTGEIAGVMIAGRWLSRAAIEQRLDAMVGGAAMPGKP